MAGTDGPKSLRADGGTEQGADGELTPRRLNRRAVYGLVLSTLVAAVGLFLLPSLRAAGLSFRVSFWALAGLEFLAAVGVAISVLRLYD
ncbi:MAG: hypothetical protein ABEJ35_03765 [Halobacteriaceae archaeon]